MTNPQITEVIGDGGHFRVFVRPPGGAWTDITMFRGIPTQISSFSTGDPFGDATAQLTFPQITAFDHPGQGDLNWLVPWADVDIIWFDINGAPTDFAWEGFFTSEEISGNQVSYQCKGALFQLDNFRAAPFFPQYPIPYELLIKETFDPVKHPSLRTSPIQIQFPANWNTKVPNFTDADYMWFLRPWGVTPGQNWTGLVSRATGAWDQALTGFVQSLLGVMWTDDGSQWTITKNKGRVPVLKVRQMPVVADDSVLTVYNGAPGVEISFSRDFSQSANVLFGTGQDLAGTVFSGQEVTADGSSTYYEPFAALPYVYPATPANPRFQPHLTRVENRIQFPQGMDELSARDAASTQLRRFADPGLTGSINLTTDPLLGGNPFPRFLVKAGIPILVKNFRGNDVLAHITQTQTNPMDGTVSLTVDTKFRDALTVAEVRARTRDALNPVNLLQVGKYSTTVQDLILPWSYAKGSGVVPSAGTSDATEFFTKIVSPNSKFPWTEWTTRYPPKKYPKYYIKVGPKNTNANKNWSGETRDGIGVGIAGIPIRMSQNGTIRLTQIAAYDANGNVLPVKFHISFYGNSGISVYDMPTIPAGATMPTGASYPAGQHYPYFKGAFEQYNPDGTLQSNPNVLLPEGADLIIGWGNYFDYAGYSPGSSSAGGTKTGLLVDEATWTFDTSNVPGFDKYSTKNTQKNKTAGLIYAMIYCDDQGSQPVYFLGRLFRQEPGTGN